MDKKALRNLGTRGSRDRRPKPSNDVLNILNNQVTTTTVLGGECVRNVCPIDSPFASVFHSYNQNSRAEANNTSEITGEGRSKDGWIHDSAGANSASVADTNADGGGMKDQTQSSIPTMIFRSTLLSYDIAADAAFHSEKGHRSPKTKGDLANIWDDKMKISQNECSKQSSSNSSKPVSTKKMHAKEMENKHPDSAMSTNRRRASKDLVKKCREGLATNSACKQYEHEITTISANAEDVPSSGRTETGVRQKQQRNITEKGKKNSCVALKQKHEEDQARGNFILIEIHEKVSRSSEKIEHYLRNYLGEDIQVTRTWGIADGVTAEVVLRSYSRVCEVLNDVNGDRFPKMNAELRRTEMNLRETVERKWKQLKDDRLRKHDTKINIVGNNASQINGETFEDFESRKALESKKTEMERQRMEYLKTTDKLFACLRVHQNDETGELKLLRRRFAGECRKLSVALPMYAERSTIIDTIRNHRVTIVMAETGSGKSTQMAQYLFEEGFAADKMIVCTQPRKVAAVSLAEHVASEMDGTVGQEVGYKAGMKSKRSQSTKIIYMTDHSLLNECMRDRLLSAFSCIIIDEAHERSIFTDLLLGMVKKCLQLRQDLKVVITSATINPEVFVNYFPFESPVVKVPGRTFPVEVIWQDEEPVSDYVPEAVKKTKHICETEPPGDVLVFLTSPQETEKACDLLQKQLSSLADTGRLVCLPLHGKLQPDDQKKVFATLESGGRKVVFATNSAETSITIPGIKYVVDTGYVKEKTYDAKRNMSSLDVVLINQSSAEQRKGRAGRTEPGKCFRLYTERTFKEMKTSSPPEILRVHLGQALLSLYELGIDDPLSFQFVESPPIDSLHEAEKNLQHLGAVRDGKITELGEKMVKLPLEPRLARMVFEGIEHGVGFEALVIASFSTVAGSVYFRGFGTDEEKNKADVLKAQFGDKNGDLLSLLNVYREWCVIPANEKTKWCVKNCINAKSMRIAAETIKEMNQTLKREVGVNLDQVFSESENCGEALAKLIFNSYAANLCMFSGNERIGYNIARLHQCVHIHPSSCLRTEGIQPEWMVYEQLLKTSRDFALNVTPVREEWVEEYAKKNGVHFDIEEMKARKIDPVVMSDTGPHLMRVLRGPAYRSLKELERKLQEKSGSSMVAVETEPGDAGGYVKLFISSCHHVMAKSLVDDIFVPERQKLTMESFEMSLDDNVKQTRAVIGLGGECRYILTSEEHKTLMISASSDYTIDEMNSIFSQFGEVEEVVKFYGKKANSTWGKVVFCEPDAADRAVKESEGKLVEARKQILKPARPLVDPQKFDVLFTWCRRPLSGIGFVQFDSLEDRYEASSRLPRSTFIRGRVVKISPAKKNENELYISGVAKDSTEDDFQSWLRNYGVTGILRLNRVKSFDTTKESFDEKKQELSLLIRPFAPSGYEVTGNLPRPGHIEYRVFVNFNDVDEGLRAINFIDKMSAIDGELVHAKPKLSASIFVAANVFNVLQPEIESARTQVEEKFRMVMNWKQTHGGSRYRVHIEGADVCSVQKAKLMLQTVVEGDVIECWRNDLLKRLFGKPARALFKKLMSSKRTYIVNDVRNMTVVIYGSEKVKSEVKLDINEFLSTYASHEYRDILLCSDEMPRGLLKELVRRYGVDFETLKTECDAEQVELIMRLRSLRVYGSDESKGKVVSVIKQVASDMSQSPVAGELSIDCVVCWSPIEKDDLQRLEYCGHPYCKECGLNMLENAVETKAFPIVCAKEECTKPLVRRDLSTFEKLQPGLMKKVKEAAVSALVQRERTKYHCCPTADCPNVYKISQSADKFTCECCQSTVCSSCHEPYHVDMTCEQYRLYKKTGGDSELKRWMEADAENRRDCPRCRTPIEKDGGCSHMTCAGCKSHICWRCGKLFRTADEYCDHQPFCCRVWKPDELNHVFLMRTNIT